MPKINLNIKVLQATGLECKSKLGRLPNTFVKISHIGFAGSEDSQGCRTKVVKGTTSPTWDETFPLSFDSGDSPLAFEIFDDGLGAPISYGTVEKAVSDVLASNRLEIIFPSCGATLFIQVERPGPSPSQTLTEVVKALDKLTEIPESTQLHPYIAVVSEAVSLVSGIVEGLLDVDQEMGRLCEAMSSLYGTLVEVVKQVLHQTIECALFIREHIGQDASPFTKSKVNEFRDAFTSLGDSLDMGLGVQTSLASIHVSPCIPDVQELALKDTLNPVVMDWSDRPTCHPRTRLEVHRMITKWIIEPPTESQSKVLWITGLAGAGKSTLATTVANMYAEIGRLGAFVFFDRDVTERSNPLLFVRTLAYELSKFDGRISAAVEGAITLNPRIAQMQLDSQFRDLVRLPLQSAASNTPGGKSLADEGPVVIVIDSLDECGNESTRKQLLNVLAKETSQLPPVFRVIITSRSEPDIYRAFQNEPHIKHYELEVSPDDQDVRMYMESRIREIAEANSLDETWPGDDMLRSFVSGAGGLFIWASTACKYIDSYDPDSALEDLLQGDGFHAGLDVLYKRALQGAWDWEASNFKDHFQAVVGFVLVAKNPLRSSTIEQLFEVPVQQVLGRLSSVIRHNDSDPVRILHTSFSEFISTSDRCGDSMWLINIPHHEYQAAAKCIRQIEKSFEAPRHFALGLAYERDYDEAVTYACEHWIHHVLAVVDDVERMEIAAAVYGFMKVHTMHWLEAMSILGMSRSTPSALERLYKWARDVGVDDTRVLAYDAYRFATFFAETIAEHPAMVTQVALPFAPLESTIYQLFHDHHELPTVMGGYEQKWSPSLRAFPILDTSVICASFSPDMTKVMSTGARFDDDTPIEGTENNCVRCWDVATGTEAMPSVELGYTSIAQFSPDGAQIWVATGQGYVHVLDASTGDQLSKLTMVMWANKPNDPTASGTTESQLQTPTIEGGFTRAAFSGDGRWVVFGDDSGELYVIDREAGKQAYDILDDCSRLEWRDLVRMFNSIAFSPDGKVFAAGSGDGNLYIWRTETGEKLFAPLEGHNAEVILVAFSPEGNKLYSASEDGNVRVWDCTTGFGINSTNINIAEISGFQPIAFSPDGRMASTSTNGTIQIWDVSTGKEIGPVLQGHFNAVSAMTFSQDGSRLVSGAFKDNIQTWDVSESRTGDLVRFSRHDRPPHTVAFSPSGLIVRSSRPDETKFWSAITGRELKMVQYDKSANFVALLDDYDGDDEEIKRKFKESRAKSNEAPDTLVTSSGDTVTLIDSLPDAQLSELEIEWEAVIKHSSLAVSLSSWSVLHSCVFYHPQGAGEIDGVVKNDESQKFWRLPRELRHRSNDVRPNFITFGIWNGRVFVVHIPQKLVHSNIPQ
ncbi:hypothetical protein PTI98_012131 [Pleurotus ostreatus]|nr:hypothetical protein PTI98_012131 [Pleurotus ostreatus]